MNQQPNSTAALRLLHLEDNVTDAELIHALLAAEWPDCHVRQVDTREDFIDALQRDSFDLILSDFSLPAFDGLTALKLANELGISAPFLFLSGTIGEDNAVEALQHGATDYVIKDRPARLVPAIRRALHQSRDQRLRQQAEQQLREQAELLDKAREAICVTDLDGRVTYLNQSAATLFNWPGNSGIAQHLHERFGRYNRATLTEAMDHLWAHGAWTGDFQLDDVEHGLRHLESSWTLVRDNHDKPKSILHIINDTTEQKQLESQLLRAQRMEGIGTLAGGIAHDLNNVFTPLLMSVSILREKNPDAETRHLLEVIETSTQHGADLVRQVLAFARGAEGKRSDIRPRIVIHDVTTLLKETLPRSIDIVTDCPADLWMVVANSTQLSQVLMNLGINARDAMPDGGQLEIQARNVTIDEEVVRTLPGAQSGPHVLITVSDTGCGIPPHVIDRIFDPFFTTKKLGKGTGLGLSTVLGIVKAQGGFLEVNSVLDRGTEFRIHLPAATTTPTVEPVAPNPLKLASGQGETVLVIDDEEGVRSVAEAFLTLSGYQVWTAPNGAAGLELFAAHLDEISVVVTDMMMPGMQGKAVIRELRKLKPDISVVAMSGMEVEQSPSASHHDRVVPLQKPMTCRQLVQAVQAAKKAGKSEA